MIYIIIIMVLIIQNNHFGNKIILFFVSVILITLYCSYLNHNFIAFCILLWYGGGITSSFVIMCEYMSIRKFESFQRLTTFFDIQYKSVFVLIILFIATVLNLMRSPSNIDVKHSDRYLFSQHFYNNSRFLSNSFRKPIARHHEVEWFDFSLSYIKPEIADTSLRLLYNSLFDDYLSQQFFIWILTHLFIYITYFIINSFTYRYKINK